MAVAGGRNAIHRVVGAHDAARSAFLDTGPERLQIHLPELPPRRDGSEGIVAALAVIIHKMLGRGHHAALFQGFHVSHAHPGVHENVLAITFLSAPPALVPRDVDDRSIDLPDAHGAEFLSHHPAHPVIKVVVESGRHADALRETGGRSPLGSVKGLSVLQHRNAPAAGRHGAARILVDGFGHLPGSGALQEVSHVPDMAGRIIPLHIEFSPIQELGRDLLHLFLRGEPSHQVFDAFFNGEGGIPELHAGRVLLLESERKPVLAGAEGLAKEGIRERDVRKRSFRNDNFHIILAPAVSNRYGSRHRGERDGALVENGGIRPDVETLPAGFRGDDSQHAGREDGQRAAAPRVVHAAGVPVSVHAHAPVFEEGVVVGMVHHETVSLAFALQGIVPMADGKKGFHHVFFHIRAGVFLGFEHLEKGIVFVPVGQAGQNGEGIHPVIGFALILRMPVARPRPGFPVDGFAQGEHLRPVGGTFGLVSQRIGHVGDGLKGQHIPHVLQEAKVAVVAPVSPVPVSLVPGHEPVGPPVISGQVALYGRIGIADGFKVSGVHVIGPDSVSAHGGQHLARQFHPVIAGNGRKEDIVRALPVAEFPDAFADQGIQRRRIRVETLSKNGHDISPPLGPFAVRTVEESVSGIYIDGPESLLPESVIKFVRATEPAVGRGVITGFPVSQARHAGSVLHRQDHPLSAEPSQGFIGLFAGLGNIFRPQAFHANLGVVGLNDNPVSAGRVFHRKDRSHLHVMGKESPHGVRIGTGLRFKGDFLDPEIFPLRYGTDVQPAQTVLQDRSRRKSIHGAGLPSFHILLRIEADIGFRQPEIGHRKVVGRTIRGMHTALPAVISDGRAVEPQLRSAAALVRKGILAQVPEQQRYAVFPLFEIRGQIQPVKIAVGRIGTAFEAAFKDNQLAVNPQPVLAVGGNPGFGHGRDGLQRNILPEGQPLVGSIRHSCTT